MEVVIESHYEYSIQVFKQLVIIHFFTCIFSLKLVVNTTAEIGIHNKNANEPPKIKNKFYD